MISWKMGVNIAAISSLFTLTFLVQITRVAFTTSGIRVNKF